MIDRRDLLLGLAAGGARAAAQTPPPAAARPVAGLTEPDETIDLWSDGAPGAPARLPVETVTERATGGAPPDRAVTGIARPRMVVFRPAVPNGAAVLVVPGGGYVRVVIDKEGSEFARWLAARGFTAFVLYYRLPGEGWADAADVPLADGQRAVRLIRRRAAAYGVSSDRVGVAGFSAGGHLCGELATRFDARLRAPADAADASSARPDAAALIYAVQSMTPPLAHAGSRAALLGADPAPDRERAHGVAANVSERTPPCFLVHAEDDGTVPVDNTLEMRAALRRAGVAVDTHLFAQGGHGFGLRRAAGRPAERWPELWRDWARTTRLG